MRRDALATFEYPVSQSIKATSRPEPYAALDAWLEGITMADQEKLELALKEVLSPKDRESPKGASNGGYHYFGSAKIFPQMGNAFAEANLKLIKK